MHTAIEAVTTIGQPCSAAFDGDPDRADLLAFQRSGDRIHLAALWTRHVDPGWRLARWICGDRADDAMQEAAIQVIVSAPRWRDQGGGSASGWLMTIIANAARKERRRDRRRWLPLEVVGELPHQVVNEEAGNGSFEQVRRGLERLSARYRQAVELRFLAGLDFPAVAAALGIPERTARTRVARGLARLRLQIGLPELAGAPGVVLLLSPARLPSAPPRVAGLVAQCPAAGAVAATAGTAKAVASAIAAVIAVGVASFWLAPWRAPVPPSPQELASEAVALEPGPVVAPEATIVPRGSDAWDAFAVLYREHGPRVVLLGRQRSLLVPASCRGRPTGSTELISAVAAEHGLHIVWLHGRSVAILQPGAADAEVEQVRREQASADASVRAHAAWSGGWLADARIVPLLVAATRDADGAVAGQARTSLRRLGWPAAVAIDADAGAAALAASSAADPPERAAAILALGRVDGEPARQRLQRAFADPDRQVRAAAVVAWADGEGGRALDLLQQWLADQDSGVASAAAQALGRIGDAKAQGLLQQAIAADQDGSGSSSAACIALAEAAGDASLPRFAAALGSGQPFQRAHAARAIGAIGGQRATELLGANLADPHAKVRSAVVYALGDCGNERAQEMLEKALAGAGADYWQCHVILQAIGMIGTERALQILAAASVDQRYPKLGRHPMSVHMAAAEELGRIGGSRALAGLLPALRDPAPAVRAAAVQGLGYLDDVSALPFLQSAFADPDPSVRASAARAMDAMGGDRALVLLEGALADPDAEVRRFTVYSLTTEGGDKVLSLLQRALADPDVGVRKVVVQCLGTWSGGTCANQLAMALADRDPRVRGCAAYELVRRGGDAGAAALRAALMDQDPTVRQVAAWSASLGRLEGAAASELMAKALADADPLVRGSAAWTLGRRGDGSARGLLLAWLGRERDAMAMTMPDLVTMVDGTGPNWRVIAGPASAKPEGLLGSFAHDDSLVRALAEALHRSQHAGD